MLAVEVLSVDDAIDWNLYQVRTYLIFVIFLHRQNSRRIKFTPKKRVNYDKIHRKLPIFCVKSVKIYTGQKKFT